jgi:predicted transcriptional regulator
MLEIISRQGATKTAIVYKTNINFKLANKYIAYLEGKSLIQRSGGGSVRLFTLTTKGREALLQLQKTMDEVLEGNAILT